MTPAEIRAALDTLPCGAVDITGEHRCGRRYAHQGQHAKRIDSRAYIRWPDATEPGSLFTPPITDFVE